MMPVLSVVGVAKSRGRRQILSSASLQAVPGELRVLLGRNGTGKSTLLKIAAGVLRPDRGTICFLNRVYPFVILAELAPDGLFYLPDRDLLSTAFTVRRQLEMIQMQFHGGNIETAAERAGITAHLDKRPHELSGGERRRAELAAVLVRRPLCVLADEPFRDISPRDAEGLSKVFVELATDGMAIVVTGHQVSTLLSIAHQVTWCVDGTTHDLGPPTVALEHVSFRRDYIGPSHHSPAI